VPLATTSGGNVVVEVEVELDDVETAASETDATVVEEEGAIVAMAF
jgi:hypothetical protein